MTSDKPLEGKRILVTRAKAQAERFAASIRKLGGIPVVIPLIRIARPKDVAPLVEAINEIQSFDWLVFTSQNGVKAFFSFMRSEKISAAQLERLNIAVVGEKTRDAVHAYGCLAKVIPSGEYTAESLAAEFLRHVKRGERVLFPRGNLARDVLPKTLREHGVCVHDVIAYETGINEEVRHELQSEVIEGRLDAIAFTSPSTVDHFVTLLHSVNWRSKAAEICLAAIGPITEQMMKKHGLQPHVVAKLNTTDGLLQAIVEFFEKEEE